MSFADIGTGLGNFGAGLAGLLGAFGEGGSGELEQALLAWNQLRQPEFNTDSQAAPVLTQGGEYQATPYDAVIAGDPSIPLESGMGRDAQANALRYFEGVRDRGLPLSDRIAAQDAQRRIMDANTAANQAAMLGAQRRGLGGTGMESALRAAASQQAMELSRGLGADLTQQAIAARQNAAAQAGGLSGAVRSQDLAAAGMSADAWNRYNEMASQLLSQGAFQTAGAQNQAQAANTSRAQQVGDQNAVNQYYANLRNQEYANQMAQQVFGNQVVQTQGRAGALGGLANARYADQAATRDNVLGLARGLGGAVGGVADYFTPGAFQGEKDKDKDK